MALFCAGQSLSEVYFPLLVCFLHMHIPCNCYALYFMFCCALTSACPFPLLHSTYYIQRSATSSPFTIRKSRTRMSDESSDKDPSSDVDQSSSEEDLSSDNEDREERRLTRAEYQHIADGTDERLHPGLHNVPPSVGSPTKSHASRNVSSPSSPESSEEEADPIVIDVNTRHVNLLEPPSCYDMGKKPKLLSTKQMQSTVNLPRCCAKTKSGKVPKAHGPCVKKFGDANDVIKNLQQLLDEENHLRRTQYDSTKKKIVEYERFQREQYRKGQKIVELIVGHKIRPIQATTEWKCPPEEP